MIARDKLRGLIAEKGLSQRDVARKLGMCDKSFYAKMRKGVFGSDEMELLIRLLDIKDPASIFFAGLGT